MKKLILSIALVATCSYATSIEDLTKDALINSSDHAVLGTFGQHDFPNAEGAFDWAFTLSSNGKSYQLKGVEPSENDAFGWKAADIAVPTPKWYMFSIDIDGDGTKSKFEWVLLSADMDRKAVYKLAGANDNGTFKYSSKIDIDYQLGGEGLITGATGTLDETPNATPPVEDDPNKLHVDDASNLRGYTIQSVNTSVGAWDQAQMTYAIDCSGNFTTTLTARLGDLNIPPSIMTGDVISTDDREGYELIKFRGTDDEGEESFEWIYLKNANMDLVINQSVSANVDNWFIESITKNSSCN